MPTTEPRYPEPPAFARALRTVGVTGTNGKTTTVRFLATMIATQDEHVASMTTVGHSIGDRQVVVEDNYAGVLALLAEAHRAGGRHAVLELTSLALGAGFMRGWPCEVGVLTSFDDDHLDLHRTREHYLASKAQLFVQLPAGGHAILQAEHPAAGLIREIVPAGVTTWTYGSPAAALADRDVTIAEVSLSWEGTCARLLSDLPVPRELRVRALGVPFVHNAVGAWLAGHALGLEPTTATAALANAEPPRGRFQRVATGPDCVVDYAHTAGALAGALATARALSRGRVSLVIGAGGRRQIDKREGLGQAARTADRVFVTNDNPRDEPPEAIAEAIERGLGDHGAVERVLDRRMAIARACNEADGDDLVLVAGKGHETVQELADGAQPFDDAAVIREVHPRFRG